MHVAAHGSAWLGMSLGSRLAISDGEIQEPDQEAKLRVNDCRRKGSPGSVQPRLLQLDARSGDAGRRPATVRAQLTSEGHWFEPSCAYQVSGILSRGDFTSSVARSPR